MSEESPRLLALMEQQDQVIAREQALGGGLSRHAIAHRLRPNGSWQRVLPGVYLTVTGSVTQSQRVIAAALHGGPLSVITGAAALRFHGLPSPESDVIDVLVPLAARRQSISYVQLHRTARLPEMVCGLPRWRYAEPARAAADAARWVTGLREARAVIAGAVQSRWGCAVEEIADELHAGPVRNSALLRRVLAEVGDGVRSAPEADLRELIREAGLPAPLFNPRLYLPDGTFLGCPDAWWAQAGLAAEVDSRRWHLSPQDWERTMARHARFAAQAIVTLHFSPHQLRGDRKAVAITISNAYQSGIRRPRLPITVLPAAPAGLMVGGLGRS